MLVSGNTNHNTLLKCCPRSWRKQWFQAICNVASYAAKT